MYVLHSVFDDLPDLLESSKGAEGRHRVPLDQDVALSEQLYGFQCGSVWTNQTLTSTNETLLVPNECLDLDDVTGHVVVKHPDGLWVGETSHDVINTAVLGDRELRGKTRQVVMADKAIAKQTVDSFNNTVVSACMA